MLRQHANRGIRFFVYRIHGTRLFSMTSPLLGGNSTIIRDGRLVRSDFVFQLNISSV